MKAIVVRDGKLVWDTAADPVPGPDEVIVHVKAAGVNRADLMQARGAYPPPAGASEILGLEIAGEVEGTGERVCALLPGGGYAGKAAVHRRMLMPLPEAFSYTQGAAIPEVWFTAFVNLFLEGGLRDGEWVLLHAAASGVGTAAIQLARDAGASVIATAGSAAKCEACLRLGASIAVNYKERDFAEAVREATGGRGVDVILDPIGGSYLPRNVESLAPFGRLVNIGLLGGSKGELNMSHVLRKRLKIIGSTLRSRQRDEQIAITREFRERYWDKIVSGCFQLVVDRTFPMAEAQAAHEWIAGNQNIGKVILTLD